MSNNHIISQEIAPSPYRYEPQDMASALRFADAVVRSGLASHIRSKEQAFVLLATGAELGLTAMQSLRSIHVIDGKPCLSADLIVGLVKRSPVCEWFRLVESTREQAVYETQRRGEPKPTRYDYTLKDAERANLLNKRSWRQHPAAMLRARAASALARAVYPDLVAGVYDPEELEHIDRSSGNSNAARRGHPTITQQRKQPAQQAKALAKQASKPTEQPSRAVAELKVVDRPAPPTPPPARKEEEEESARAVPEIETQAPEIQEVSVSEEVAQAVPEIEEGEVVEAVSEIEATEVVEEEAIEETAEVVEEEAIEETAEVVEEETIEEDEGAVDLAEEKEEEFEEREEEPKIDPLITLPGIGKALSARLKEAEVYTLEQFVAFAEGEEWRDISGFFENTRNRALTAARQRLSELAPTAPQTDSVSTREESAETVETHDPTDQQAADEELAPKRDAIADMGLRDAAKHIAKHLVRAGLYRSGDITMKALAAQVQELGVQPTEASLDHLAQAWLNVEANHRI